MLVAAIEDILQLWRRSGVDVRPPAHADEVARAQGRLGVRFPDEVLAFYATVDGMARADDEFPFSGRHIRIWPLSELRRATPADSGNFAGGVVFADFMLHSHEYCFQPNGAVILAIGDGSRIVSSSLTEFLEGYAADNPTVFGAA